MPSQGRRPAASGKRAGFTLIEILVVLVIIGIVTAMAFLSIGLLGDDRALQRHATRITTLMEMASDEAQMQGREFGVELMRTGYRFVEYDPLLVQWGEIIGDDLLRPRDLDDDMEFELFLEDRRILLDETAADTRVPDRETERELGESYEPHLLIMSSGDITPFELRIVRNLDRRSVLVALSPNGEIDIQSEDEQAF